MTPRREIIVATGLLALGLGLPQTSQAITGCGNSYLNGVYGAQITSVNLLNAVSSNGSGTNGGTTTGGTSTGSTSTGSTSTAGGGNGGGSIAAGNGSTSSTGTGNATGTTTGNGSTTNTATGTNGTEMWANGLGNSRASLNESGAALGRFLFDGQGNIIGRRPMSTNSATLVQDSIGTYTVNTDCTARVTMASGQTYDGVVVNGGDQVLFVQTNANGGGTSGSLLRSRNSCTQSDFPSSFGFRFVGLTQAASPSTGSTGLATGSTGTGATPTTAAFQPYSTIGLINLDGAGNFRMTQSVYGNSAFQRYTSSGTYAVNQDCALSLTFDKPMNTGTGSGSGATFIPPTAFRGLVTNNGLGLLSLQQDQNNLLTGEFFPQ